MSDIAMTPLAAALRRYSYAYTAAHDISVARQILAEDYELTMGAIVLRGRDSQYIPAVEKQLRRFPGLGFTVHGLVLGDNRAALHFSEHGRSTSGSSAAWTGIALYNWDGAWLTHCRVEQDYHSQQRQLSRTTPNTLLPPAIDPFTQGAAAADPEVEAAVGRWLTTGGIDRMPAGTVDDEHCAPTDRIFLEDQRTTILDLFTAGNRAAFHIRTDGLIGRAPAQFQPYLDRTASLFATGIATIDAGNVEGVHAVTDRLAAYRRLVDSEQPS